MSVVAITRYNPTPAVLNIMKLTYSTPSGVDRSTNASTTDATMAIGIKCLRH